MSRYWAARRRGPLRRVRRMRRIGVLMGFAENDEVWQSYLAAFKRALQELGWIEGRNLRLYYRWPGENTERTRMAAEELVALAPDLLFVTTNPALSAVMQATRQIPIVFNLGVGFCRKRLRREPRASRRKCHRLSQF